MTESKFCCQKNGEDPLIKYINKYKLQKNTCEGYQAHLRGVISFRANPFTCF